MPPSSGTRGKGGSLRRGDCLHQAPPVAAGCPMHARSPNGSGSAAPSNPMARPRASACSITSQITSTSMPSTDAVRVPTQQTLLARRRGPTRRCEKIRAGRQAAAALSPPLLRLAPARPSGTASEQPKPPAAMLPDAPSRSDDDHSHADAPLQSLGSLAHNEFGFLRHDLLARCPTPCHSTTLMAQGPWWNLPKTLVRTRRKASSS